MPTAKYAKSPKWNKQKLLKGVNLCIAHPLYHPKKWKGNILEAK